MASLGIMKKNAPLKSDDEVDLGLSGDVEVTSLPRLSLESDLLLLGVEVLLDVLVGPLEDDLSLGLLGLITNVSLDTPKTMIKRIEKFGSAPKDG